MASRPYIEYFVAVTLVQYKQEGQTIWRDTVPNAKLTLEWVKVNSKRINQKLTCDMIFRAIVLFALAVIVCELFTVECA